MKYAEDVAAVCGENWMNASLEEKEGGYGVAIVSAYIDGCDPVLYQLAIVLLRVNEVPIKEDAVDDFIDAIRVPYQRLQAYGVFTSRMSARKDKALIGEYGEQDGRTAWCHIAGVASGICGKTESQTH